MFSKEGQSFGGEECRCIIEHETSNAWQLKIDWVEIMFTKLAVLVLKKHITRFKTLASLPNDFYKTILQKLFV